MKDNLVYRFRSTNALLGENKELENQEIYFAPIDELNDPLEGAFELIFKGDKIVWENLFKHYLSHFYGLIMFNKERLSQEQQLTWRDIPFEEDIPSLLKYGYKDDFTKIKNTFLDKCKGIINKLTIRKQPITQTELHTLLSCIHYILIECFAKHRPQFKTGVDSADFIQSIENGLEIFDDSKNKDLLNLSFNILNSISVRNTIVTNNMLRADFIEAYIQSLHYLAYPMHYIACFSANANNPTMWGHYANSHKGVCLIFKANNNQIKLAERNLFDNSMYDRDYKFESVKYTKRKIKFNFFEEISMLPLPRLMSIWCQSECGEISRFFNKIHQKWENNRAEKWEARKNAHLIKTKHWQYEKEYRLVKYSMFGSRIDKKECKANYRFQDLEGIIFGIKTSMADKIKIFNIIQEKCQKEKRTDFKFYQAYFCHKTQQILYFHII